MALPLRGPRPTGPDSSGARSGTRRARGRRRTISVDILRQYGRVTLQCPTKRIVLGEAATEPAIGALVPNPVLAPFEVVSDPDFKGDGLLGANLLERFTVRIDFKRGTMRINHMSFESPLHPPMPPLPAQPRNVAWPTGSWPVGEPPARVDLAPLLDEAFKEEGPLARTFAVAVVHRGRLVAQRYAHAIDHFDRPSEPITETTPLLSWSMAKSMLHAVVGMLVAEGRLDLNAAADVPEWRDVHDGRERITLQHLLEMRDGLDFLEDYVDADRSDVIEMLFGAGAADVAHFAADRPLAAEPGTRFNYSSGTSNIVSAIVGRVVGTGAAYDAFLRERLFEPIGMHSATARFDEAGNWIASSYVHATAQDFARFGYLYLRDGVWDGRRIVPEGWVDHGRRLQSDDGDGGFYGAHWWVHADAYGRFRCNGYEGQRIVVVPALDLVIVRSGKTPASHYADIGDWLRRVIDAFAATS